MPLRPTDLVNPRGDHTQAVVGREGVPVRQDVDGTQIQRLGVAGADADWGPETETIDAGGEIVAAEPDSVGGTQSVAGIVRSNDGLNCSLVVVWAADNDTISTVYEAENSNTAFVERPLAAQEDTEHVIADLTTKGDDAIVFVEDAASATFFIPAGAVKESTSAVYGRIVWEPTGSILVEDGSSITLEEDDSIQPNEVEYTLNFH